MSGTRLGTATTPLIATGRSDVQVRAIARGIEERMGLEDENALSIDGISHGHWAVLDFNDVVVHVFPGARSAPARAGLNSPALRGGVALLQ